MTRKTFAFILLCICFKCAAQVHADASVTFDLNKIDQLQIERDDKINAAFTAMEAVQKAGRYIQSLSDLFGNGEVTLPVGIKNGDYELIIQKIRYDEKTGQSLIYATCAFRFKDTGQRVAFEGQTSIQGHRGLGTSGELTLIAPVRRNIGKEATIIVQEGTRVRFGCDGVESFAAKLTWLVTSPDIIPVDPSGKPTNTPIAATFDTFFQSFDNYIVSLNINQSFMFKGLNDIVFTIRGATLDQSDTETSAMIRFPEKYFSSDDEISLWKGVAITEAGISLPAIFKNPVSDGRITLALNQVLLDANGFTGKATAYDVLNSLLLDPHKWDMSLNDFSLDFLKNELVSFGFGGDINIPPFGKNSLFPYMAEYNPAREAYEFKVGVAGTYDFPVLRSTVQLYETSTIEILLRDSEIYPTIHASGLLTVNAPLNPEDSTKVFSVPDIVFENMKISREAPYLTIGFIGVSGELRSPQVAGFELLISNIMPFENTSGTGLSFDAGITLSDIFGGTTSILLYGDYARWKFNKVSVDKILVNYQSKAFSLAGGVWLKNSDLIYGDGFRGELGFSLLEKFEFEAVAVFGKKDNYKYFLTDVLYETTPAAGIHIPPALSFYGFGGGLYRRMQQTANAPASDFGKSKSGINYIPDRNVGMGVMTSTKFALSGSDKAFNAKVGLEIQFNKDGGLNFVQLRGDAAFMDMPDKWGKLTNNVTERLAKLNAEGNQLKKAKKEDLKAPENKSTGFLTASLNVQYDVINSAFSADLNTYLNAGVIRGVGEDNRMGFASAHFSPDKWYTYIGTPSDRFGIEVVGLVRTDGYFMLGADIPGLPLPPDRVLRNLSADKQNRLARETSDVTSGKGIAFGASFDYNFKAKLPPFYAGFGIGLGAEFLLIDRTKSPCSDYPGIPGINGWYASVQAWAYIEAAIGIEAKIFRKTRQFNILDISAGALLEGAGPNPLYFSGAVGGRFNVLGGLIKGKCSFDFEIGEKCISPKGSPFGEDIIAQLTPSDGEKDINVFAAPQAVFNIPVGIAMTIDEEDGSQGTYMVTLEEFSVRYKDNNTTITGYQEISTDGTVCLFDPNEPFESRKDLTVYARVGFKKKMGGNWVNVKGDDGEPIYEDRSETFSSGDRPKEILAEHVKYSYPIARQYNFYPDEYKEGYIQLTENYSYLFTTDKPENFDQLLRIGSLSGESYETGFTFRTNDAGNKIRMDIDFSLAKVSFAGNHIYKMAIVNVPQFATAGIKSNITAITTAATGLDSIAINKQQAEGSLERPDEKEIYALHFRTSHYPTFKQKMAAYDTRGEGWRDYVDLFVHHIKANLKADELFDKYEVQWDENVLPMVRFEAQINRTEWYSKSFYKNMYQSSYQQGIVANRKQIDMREFGEPPVAAVQINVGEYRTVTDIEVATGSATGYTQQSVFAYTLPYWCSRDFFYMKSYLSQKKLYEGGISSSEESLLANDFPPVVKKGIYPVQVRYVLPGREIETSVMEIEMYNPVE